MVDSEGVTSKTPFAANMALILKKSAKGSLESKKTVEIEKAEQQGAKQSTHAWAPQATPRRGLASLNTQPHLTLNA
ncbi:hypothetical protein PIB30_040157 [Stylosanthes scabra]|uniref:Uncharacterized protein n=1 Tax=Stylosanthes scabra TaxID=79078 RepID=A0ABU6WCM6_9FABA|nr:hypothetical protein [Stylosanthes scabra]